MPSESKQDKARRLASEGKVTTRKLALLHKIFLYASAAILALGKFIYSFGILDTVSLSIETGKECIYVPSYFDVIYNDVVAGATLIFVISLYTAMNYLED